MYFLNYPFIDSIKNEEPYYTLLINYLQHNAYDHLITGRYLQ